MKLKNQSLIATVALTGLLGACASTSTPPSQLIHARDAYAVSKTGSAAKVSPTELYDAKKALDRANQEFEQHGDTLECRDYAYIAHRKLELVEVKARTELDRRKIAEAVRSGVKTTQTALATTREQLKTERLDNKTSTNELRAANTAQNKELESEKQARVSAEGKLAGAMKDLAAIAAIKEEARGMVITLSGSVLFASGKHALLNTAMTKLDQVAEALKAQDADRRMVVEGHTDSQGSDKVNQPLSLNRATAVRDYLVSRGVASEKISAIGMSSSKPIADNKTPENRANNRRVEIIIGGSKVSTL